MREENDKGEPTAKWETVNKASALWARPKNEIKDDEYKEFYKHVSHDFTDPLTWTHNRVEGKTEYTSLLYIPSQAPFAMFEPNPKHGVKLYVQRVFIMDDAEKLLPRYLRFIRGVIDSNDLPLNISREILQSNKIIDNIRSGRKKPGLMRQHLTCVNAAAKIGKARVKGNYIGSESLFFEPTTIKAGSYDFSVGTAGSTTLVLQSILPALLIADGKSELTLKGGTHNPYAPPFDFLEKAFLPILEKMGAKVNVKLRRC